MASGVVNLRLSEPLLAEYGAGLIGGELFCEKSGCLLTSFKLSHSTLLLCTPFSFPKFETFFCIDC